MRENNHNKNEKDKDQCKVNTVTKANTELEKGIRQ